MSLLWTKCISPCDKWQIFFHACSRSKVEMQLFSYVYYVVGLKRILPQECQFSFSNVSSPLKWPLESECEGTTERNFSILEYRWWHWLSFFPTKIPYDEHGTDSDVLQQWKKLSQEEALMDISMQSYVQRSLLNLVTCATEDQLGRGAESICTDLFLPHFYGVNKNFQIKDFLTHSINLMINKRGTLSGPASQSVGRIIRSRSRNRRRSRRKMQSRRRS